MVLGRACDAKSQFDRVAMHKLHATLSLSSMPHPKRRVRNVAMASVLSAWRLGVRFWPPVLLVLVLADAPSLLEVAVLPGWATGSAVCKSALLFASRATTTRGWERAPVSRAGPRSPAGLMCSAMLQEYQPGCSLMVLLLLLHTSTSVPRFLQAAYAKATCSGVVTAL